MGIGKLIEEVAGAVAAERAAVAADPNAGILLKGAAAVAGFVGVGKIHEAVEGHIQHNKDMSQDAAQDAQDVAKEAANPDDVIPPEPK